jgi:cytochrome c biogenesis protein CcmG/thiol:disulfide interchange protein DsbE
VKKRRVNTTILLLGALLFAPLIVLLARSFGRDPRAVPSVLERRPAPAFDLVDLDGTRWSLASLKGTPVVLNFWSTWCGPCKQEHPLLLEAQARWPNVRFLGVIYEDDPARAQAYLRTAGSAYPHLLDPSGKVAIEYGVAGVPESFVIDRDGTILHKQVGPFSPAALEAHLGPLGDQP